MSRRLPSLHHCALTAALLGGPPLASAAPPVDEAPPRARILAANALARAGSHADALLIYRQIAEIPDAIDDRAGLLGNMGHCLHELGRHREALATFREALAEARDAETRATLERVIAHIEATAFGALTIDCDVPGARIHLPDGDPLPCPSTLTGLDPGPLLVLGETDDGLDARGEALIVAGDTTVITLHFPARLIVDGAADDVVQIDGEHHCATPCTAALSAGATHDIEVRRDGRTWRTTVDTQPGGTHRLAPQFDDDDTWLWVGAGLGAAAVAGTVIGLLATADEPRTRMHFTTVD